MLALGLANRAAGPHRLNQLLRQIAETTGETVNFVRPEPGGMQYVDRIQERPSGWRFPSCRHVPFHCTAKASLPSPEDDRLTPNTHMQRRHIRRDGIMPRRGIGVSRSDGRDRRPCPIRKADRRRARRSRSDARFGLDTALASRDLLHDYAARISLVIFGDRPDRAGSLRRPRDRAPSPQERPGRNRRRIDREEHRSTACPKVRPRKCHRRSFCLP